MTEATETVAAAEPMETTTAATNGENGTNGVAAAESTEEPETPKESDVNYPIVDIDETAKFIDELEEGAQQLSIDCENHHATLLGNMEKLKNDKDTCDVILRVKKGNFYWASFWAHKAVLAAHSPVFAEALKKFQTYALPAVETVCRPNLVLPRKIHGAALAALVDWMYTGKLTVHRKALGHLPLVANFLKVQPIIDRLDEIFADFKESGVKLIDEEVEGEIEIGKENDDNEDEESESKAAAAAANTEAAEGDEKKKKEWVVNLWLKRKVADQLPAIKPIPGFYIMLQSDAHRVKSSRGRKGQDPFDPPEAIMDTNWLAAYNQFKAKQLHIKKNMENNRGRGRGRGMMRGGPQRGFMRGGPRGGGPPFGFRGGPRGGAGPNFNRGGGPGYMRGGPRGGYGGPMNNYGGPGYGPGFYGHGPPHPGYGGPRGGYNGGPRGGGGGNFNRGGFNPGARGGPRGGGPRGGRGGRGFNRGANRSRPY